MKVIIQEVGAHLKNNALEELEKNGVEIISRGSKIDLEIEDQELTLGILKYVLHKYGITFG